MRNVAAKSCRENQNTFYAQRLFFSSENLNVYEIMWKNMVQPETTDINIIRRRALHVGQLRLKTHTQNIYCLLLFHCNNGYTSAPKCYIVRTLPILLDVMPCILVSSNVSKDDSAFTFKVKALRSLKTSVTISQSTMCNIPEDMNIQEVKI